MKKNRVLLSIGSLFLTGVLFESCVSKSQTSRSAGGGETVKVSLNVAPSEGLKQHGLHLVAHKKGKKVHHKKGLDLAAVDAVTDWKASVHGCDRFPIGAPTTISKDGTFSLYKKATGCYVVLNSLTVGDFTYEMPATMNAGDWNHNSVTDFKASSGDTHIAHVKVDKQLTSPVFQSGVTSSVTFSFTITAKGQFNGQFASTKMSAGVTVNGKQPLPDFVINHQENNIEIDTSVANTMDYHFSLFVHCEKTDDVKKCNGVDLASGFDYVFTDTNVAFFSKEACLDAFTDSKKIHQYNADLQMETVGGQTNYFFETVTHHTKSKKVALILRAKDANPTDSSFKYFIFELPDNAS